MMKEDIVVTAPKEGWQCVWDDGLRFADNGDSAHNSSGERGWRLRMYSAN